MKFSRFNRAQKKALSDALRNLGLLLFGAGIFALIYDDSRVYEKVFVIVLSIIVWIIGIRMVEKTEAKDTTE